MSTFRVPMSGVFIENRYRARSLLVIHLLFVPVNCKQNPIDKSFAGVKLDFDFAKKKYGHYWGGILNRSNDLYHVLIGTKEYRLIVVIISWFQISDIC